MNWNFNITAAGAQQTLSRLRGHFDGMFNEMSSGITSNIMKFNAWQVALDYCVDAGKQLVKESRELIAISSKYDIPISKMGSLQMMAAQTGQSVGQLARGFRFLEMNMGRALLKPGGPQYQAFKELGISQEQMNQAAGDTMYALEIVREKVMRIGDEERRNAFLQEIFGANWQNVLPIIEQSATAQRDAASAGYEYSASMTESLAGVATTMEEIAQDVKPVIMPIVQVVAILVTMLGFLIEGLKISIMLIGHGIVNAFRLIVAEIQLVIGGVAKLTGMFQKLIGLKSLGGITESVGDSMLDSAKGHGKAIIKDYTEGGMAKTLIKGSREVQKSGDRFARQSYALGESLGMVDENQYIKEAKEDLTKKLNEINMEKQLLSDLRKDVQQKVLDHAAGKATKDELNASVERVKEQQSKLKDLVDEGKRMQEKFDRAGGQKELDKINGIKPRTQEERKVELQTKRQERERGIKEYMANTPLIAEMETYNEMVKSKMELKKLEQDLADIRANNADNIQAIADLENQIGNAKISIMEKEKAHKAFILKKDREIGDSEKGRKDDMIKAMQEREQQYMTRQGMTGMDKQSTVVSNAIEQMQRDQAQLEKVMNDPMRTTNEKLEAKKKLEGSTMGAMKEFDKLSLMQFQYSASDAAKKGMGGGIDVRENQLSVSKEQLDYLKRSYELQLKQFGLSPDQFGNVPFQMQGPMRGGK